MNEETLYEINVHVPEDSLDFYVAKIDELGFLEPCESPNGQVNSFTTNYEYNYTLPSDKKDILLNFCVDNGFRSWCVPVHKN